MATKVEVTCDKCGKDLQENFIEEQESLHWSMSCGYGSVFGDLNTITLDLCQDCTKEILGAYIQCS